MYNRGMAHLSTYMAERNLSDEAVARELECSRVTVSRIRRRKVRPDWKTIEKIRVFTKGVCSADDFQMMEEAS